MISTHTHFYARFLQNHRNVSSILLFLWVYMVSFHYAFGKWPSNSSKRPGLFMRDKHRVFNGTGDGIGLQVSIRRARTWTNGLLDYGFMYALATPLSKHVAEIAMV